MGSQRGGHDWATSTNTLISFSSVQSLSCVRLFATPWITARQAFLSITNPRSLLKLMPIESVMPSSHLILCRPWKCCSVCCCLALYVALGMSDHSLIYYPHKIIQYILLDWVTWSYFLIIFISVYLGVDSLRSISQFSGDWFIFLKKSLYFILECCQLTMLWSFQVDNKGTQPYIYMCPFFSKLPSHPVCYLTLSRVPCAIQ